MNEQKTLTYPDGAKYVGEVNDGLPNGQGTFTSPKGMKYVGKFQVVQFLHDELH